jgi:hypothetical protein
MAAEAMAAKEGMVEVAAMEDLKAMEVAAMEL